MGYLTDRLVKRKKLYKSSGSLVVIIPTPWINEMNWSRETILKMSWNPGERKIILEEDKESNEKVSEPKP